MKTPLNARKLFFETKEKLGRISEGLTGTKEEIARQSVVRMADIFSPVMRAFGADDLDAILSQTRDAADKGDLPKALELQAMFNRQMKAKGGTLLVPYQRLALGIVAKLTGKDQDEIRKKTGLNW